MADIIGVDHNPGPGCRHRGTRRLTAAPARGAGPAAATARRSPSPADDRALMTGTTPAGGACASRRHAVGPHAGTWPVPGGDDPLAPGTCTAPSGRDRGKHRRRPRCACFGSMYPRPPELEQAGVVPIAELLAAATRHVQPHELYGGGEARRLRHAPAPVVRPRRTGCSSTRGCSGVGAWCDERQPARADEP